MLPPISIEKSENPYKQAYEKFEKELVDVSVVSFGPVGKSKVPKRRIIRISKIPRNIGYQREEFDEKDDIFSITDTDFMAMPSNEVMYGSPQKVIDEMPSMARMLVEDQTFISFSNRLFRMVDPETQASSYLANKKLQIKNGRSEFIRIKPHDSREGYEFENGGGIDEEEITDWEDGGQGPTLLAFIRDIMPDHQCDEAQLVILETSDEKNFIIPESEDHMIKILGGEVLLTVIHENEETVYELTVNDRIMIEGLKLIQISCKSVEDAVIVIGKTTRNEESNDLLTYVMSRGYQDVHTMHEGEKEKEVDIFENGLDFYNEEEETPLYDCQKENHFVIEGIIPDLSSLGNDIPKNEKEQTDLYYKETNGRISINEWKIRKKHKKFMNLLSDAFDSPYVGRGFRQPAIRWMRIFQETESIGSIKAQERNDYFMSLHARAKQIKSYHELFGSKTWICPKCGMLNEHTGFDCINTKCKEPEFANKTGFYAKIKEKNIHDREIGKEWSEQPQKIYDEEIGEWVTKPSSFHLKRDEKIKEWKEEGLDDRIIERKLWHWFDRKAGKQAALYDYKVVCSCGRIFRKRLSIEDTEKLKCPNCKSNKGFTEVTSLIAKDKNNKIIKTKVIEESIWRQNRNEAFLELYLTKAQWNTIYKQLAIQKRRILLGESLTEDRQLAYNTLRDYFKDCETIQDLNDFKAEAYEQQIDKEGNIIVPSLIDRISFGDERRIIIAIAKKSKEIFKETKGKMCK
jgi:hypothetical protein